MGRRGWDLFLDQMAMTLLVGFVLVYTVVGSLRHGKR